MSVCKCVCSRSRIKLLVSCAEKDTERDTERDDGVDVEVKESPRSNALIVFEGNWERGRKA